MLLLVVALGFGAEVWLEVRFVVFLEVILVRVCDCDVVVEGSAAEDELLTPGGGFAEDGEGVVGEDAENHVVKGFFGGFAGLRGVDAEFDTVVGAGEDGLDFCVCANGDSLALEVDFPLLVELVEVIECDHSREVWKQSLRIIIPELHVRIVEQSFDDSAGDAGGLVACTEEQGDQRIDHLVAKSLAEEEDAEHNVDGDEAKNRHRPLNDLEESPKSLDIRGVL